MLHSIPTQPITITNNDGTTSTLNVSAQFDDQANTITVTTDQGASPAEPVTFADGKTAADLAQAIDAGTVAIGPGQKNTASLVSKTDGSSWATFPVPSGGNDGGTGSGSYTPSPITVPILDAMPAARAGAFVEYYMRGNLENRYVLGPDGIERSMAPDGSGRYVPTGRTVPAAH